MDRGRVFYYYYIVSLLGVVSDFDGYQELIVKCFTRLKTEPSAQTCFIIVAPKTPQHHKERIAKYLFEVCISLPSDLVLMG
jgi:hypothetical protein